MNNNTILLKIKERLNKLDSNDYTNIEVWQFVEAFNKGMVDLCRENTRGINITREGDEQSISRIDDLQRLIVDPLKLKLTDKGIFYQTSEKDWPKNYLRFKGVDVSIIRDCCPTPKPANFYLGEDSNVTIYLRDVNKKPSYEWGESFLTLTGNKINLYHDNQFEVDEAFLNYYRQPIRIEIAGYKDPYTGLITLVDVECEFQDDLIEVFISKAASIIAGDIESIQKQRLDPEIEKTN